MAPLSVGAMPPNIALQRTGRLRAAAGRVIVGRMRVDD